MCASDDGLGEWGEFKPLGTPAWCNCNPKFGFGVYDFSACLLYLYTSVNYGTKMFLNFIWTVLYCKLFLQFISSLIILLSFIHVDP